MKREDRSKKIESLVARLAERNAAQDRGRQGGSE